MKHVEIARVGRPHGIEGELYVDECSLSPDELKALGQVEWRGRDGRARVLTVHAVRQANDRLLVRFLQVMLREIAATLTNGTLWVAADRLPDPGPGLAYTFQFVGLKLVTTAGGELGVIREVVSVGDRYFCTTGPGKTLLPIHVPFLKSVDFEAGVMTVELPAGFEELM